MSKAPQPSLSEWLEATMDLMPQGLAWPRDLASNIGKLLGWVADERKRRHERALTLLEAEAVPTAAVELLPDWEQALGLPDPCRAAPGALGDRWAAVSDVFFGDHPPTPANMQQWAAQAGWDVSMREQRDFVAGVSMAGDVVGESDFAWVVTVNGVARTYF